MADRPQGAAQGPLGPGPLGRAARDAGTRPSRAGADRGADAPPRAGRAGQRGSGRGARTAADREHGVGDGAGGDRGGQWRRPTLVPALLAQRRRARREPRPARGGRGLYGDRPHGRQLRARLEAPRSAAGVPAIPRGSRDRAVSLRPGLQGGPREASRRGHRSRRRPLPGVFANPALTWERLEWLRGTSSLPLVLKGILHPEDATEARERGVDGIVVSNHGGRQIDGAIASLDALPAIVDAVGDDLTVILDSGIRSGADAFKALALGADAVLIGRPYLWGLALDGRNGVETVLRGILAELDLTMALSSCTALGDLEPGLLRRV